MLKRVLIIAILGIIFHTLSAKAETKKPQIKPRPKVISATRVQLEQWIKDFQGEAEAVRNNAAINLEASGNLGYRLLSPLSQGGSETAKRAQKVIKKIFENGKWLRIHFIRNERTLKSGELTVAKISELRREAMQVASYVPQNAFRKSIFKSLQELQVLEQQVRNALHRLSLLDRQLNSSVKLAPASRARIQNDRLEFLLICRKDEEMIRAATEILNGIKPEWNRFAPQVHEKLIRLYSRTGQVDKKEESCRKILAEHPNSVQTTDAYKGLLEILLNKNKVEDAIVLSKKFLKDAPRSKEARKAAFDVFGYLEDQIGDYVQAATFAEFLMKEVPLTDLDPNIPFFLANFLEYLRKDYPTARKQYEYLRNGFGDFISKEEAVLVEKRLTEKEKGTFPAEPKPDATTPAGCLGRLIRAVRVRDTKTVVDCVVADLREDYREWMVDPESSFDDFLPTVTFGDMVVVKTNLDPTNKARAILEVNQYSFREAKPLRLKIPVVRETSADGKQQVWRLDWEGEFEEEERPSPLLPAPQPKIQPNQ